MNSLIIFIGYDILKDIIIKNDDEINKVLYDISLYLCKHLSILDYKVQVFNHQISFESILNNISHGREICKSKIFISLNCNRSDNLSQRGLETYYVKSSTKSEVLAKNLQREIVKATKIYNRGIYENEEQTKNHCLLSTEIGFSMAAVSLYLGFSSNPTEKAFILNRDFTEKVASAIIKAVLKI